MEAKIKLTKKVADFLLAKRKRLGLTQKEFAVKLFGHEKHQGWVHKIEHGRGITIETLDKILDALEVDFELVEY